MSAIANFQLALRRSAHHLTKLQTLRINPREGVTAARSAELNRRYWVQQRERSIEAWKRIALEDPDHVAWVAATFGPTSPTYETCNSVGVLALWVEALSRTPTSGKPAVAALWEAMAAASVRALTNLESRSWLDRLLRRPNVSALEDIARLATAFSIAAPELGVKVGLFDAVAEATQKAGGGIDREGEFFYRHAAFACSTAGHARVDIFGPPDIRAEKGSSKEVWLSIERQLAMIDDEGADKDDAAVEALARGPLPVLYHKNWLSEEETQRLLETAEPLFEASELAVPGAPRYRTSQSAVLAESRLDEKGVELSKLIRSRAAAMLGLPSTHVEPLQLVRYGPGDYYARHHDWGGRDDPSLWIAGQRVATGLAYLDLAPECKEGGTAFLKLDLKINPVPRALVLWPNVLESGEPSDLTEHQAEPPQLKEGPERPVPDEGATASGGPYLKVALNIWIRDRPIPTAW